MGEEAQRKERVFAPGGNERSAACADEDGGLIGGAALKVPDFLQIIAAANQD